MGCIQSIKCWDGVWWDAHPVLLQLKQLPQTLQEDRLRDLPVRKLCKVCVASSFYNPRQKLLNMTIQTIKICRINIVIAHHNQLHCHYRHHHSHITIMIIDNIKESHYITLIQWKDGWNLWKASTSSADVHPSNVVPRPEQTHLRQLHNTYYFTKSMLQVNILKLMNYFTTRFGQP